MIEWVTANWEMIVTVGGMVLGADGILGFLPDRYIAYIGLLRRIIEKIREKK